jgi:hypothetical protein
VENLSVKAPIVPIGEKGDVILPSHPVCTVLVPV